MRYSDQFVRVVTEKLLTYALGRGVEDGDMPIVRSIVRDSAPSQYRISSIVLGIVKSDPFQMNQKESSKVPELQVPRFEPEPVTLELVTLNVGTTRDKLCS